MRPDVWPLFDTFNPFMKTLLLTAFFFTQLVSRGVAGSSVLPEIPVSKLGISQALAIFEKQMHDSTNHYVVSVDWYRASEFQPGIGDFRYSPGPDHSGEYSWFITYIYKNEQRDKELRETGTKRRFNEVGVVRIKDDGKIGYFVGAR
jgi:hypothetical protein